MDANIKTSLAMTLVRAVMLDRILLPADRGSQVCRHHELRATGASNPRLTYLDACPYG